MKYLFIGAHPDDIEYSCGGTIQRLLHEGHEVYMVVMTYGSENLTDYERERITEQLNASRKAKVNDLIMLDYTDGMITVTRKAVGEISDILETYQPDFVYTHYPNDSHQDHRAVSAIVKSATRRKYSLIYFDSYSSIDFKPNLYVDITHYALSKKKIIGCFTSQIEKFKKRNIGFTRKSLLTNELNGYECNSDYAEGFAIDTYMI